MKKMDFKLIHIDSMFNMKIAEMKRTIAIVGRKTWECMGTEEKNLETFFVVVSRSADESVEKRCQLLNSLISKIYWQAEAGGVWGRSSGEFQ